MNEEIESDPNVVYTAVVKMFSFYALIKQSNVRGADFAILFFCNRFCLF